MTNSGEIKTGKELGFRSIYKKWMWYACPDCYKEYWVMLKKGKPQTLRCASCAGKIASIKRHNTKESHPNWKGGRHQCSTGYIQIVLEPSSAYFTMADKRGRIFEHRLVMAKKLGRYLEPFEEVHHKNGNKHDNSPENLELSFKGRHNENHTISKLLARIKELETQLAMK